MKKTMLVVLSLLISATMMGNSLTDFDLNNLTIKEFHQLKNELLSLNSGRDFRDEYMLEVLYQEWLSEQWENAALETYFYDSNGFAIEMLQQAWADEVWQNYSKMIFTNNAEGLPIETLWQMWETNSQTWMDVALMLMEYDANGNMTEMLIQMWFGTMWMDSSRRTMTYNTDNNPTYILTEEWDFDGGGGWINDDQETFTYDGLFLEEVLEEDWENGIWNNMKLDTFSLLGNYHPADKLLQTWNGGGYWDNTRYSVYTYDGDWNEIEDLEQEWNGAWENMSLKLSTYNEDGWMIERLSQDWEPTRNWVNDTKYTITYGTLSTGEELAVPQINLTNYPNPFNPSTQIRFQISDFSEIESAEIIIYNLKGQIVKTFSKLQINNSQNHQIIWNGTDKNNQPVTSGIYFFKFKTGNFEKTKKMILIK